MKPEAKVKAAVKAILKEYGAWYFCPVSNGMGTHGIPDFIVCYLGQFVAIECKAGNGTTTALQDMQLNAIAASGGRIRIVNEDDIDRVRYLLKDIERMHNYLHPKPIEGYQEDYEEDK